MDKISLEKQILSTNDWGLLAILNEGLMDKLEESKQAIDREDYKRLNQLNNVSRDILTELIVVFKNDNEVSRNLRDLYLFINKLTTEGENKRDKKYFDRSKEIIKPILEAFRERELEDVANIVSGLTYGERDLSEHKTKSSINFEG